MEAKLTNVYRRNADAFLAGHNLMINQGGQGSSKTFSILQILYHLAKYQKRARRITIVSYALPHLKAGAMLDFERIIESHGDNPFDGKNKTESIYEIGNSVIEFLGMEGNLAKAHGPRRDILFINECNRKLSYEVFDQLNSRTQEYTFLDFNPDMEFWLHEKVIPIFKHVLIKSTFLDNPYLPERERNNILMKKDKPGFENWWRVYGEGELGRLEGAILSNWRYFNQGEEWPSHLSSGFGLDFGYNNPDALLKLAVDHKNKKCYWDEKVYKSGNSFGQLQELLHYHCTRNDLIIADCAEARLINELRKIFNIKPVNKKAFTVAEGLKMMQDYEHIITETSYNLAKELNSYIWNDKRAGIPIDDFNHLIDAGRYKFIDTLRGGGKQIWRG